MPVREAAARSERRFLDLGIQRPEYEGFLLEIVFPEGCLDKKTMSALGKGAEEAIRWPTLMAIGRGDLVVAETLGIEDAVDVLGLSLSDLDKKCGASAAVVQDMYRHQQQGDAGSFTDVEGYSESNDLLGFASAWTLREFIGALWSKTEERPERSTGEHTPATHPKHFTMEAEGDEALSALHEAMGGELAMVLFDSIAQMVPTYATAKRILSQSVATE